MDIRNINKDLSFVDGLKGIDKLKTIYEAAIEQLKGYINIEHLPVYPLEDINTKSSQDILKDFIGRIIEELSEGYESTSELYNNVVQLGGNISMASDYNSEILIPLQNANEEQADAIGFFITLLLYSNILPEDIASYVDNNYGNDKEVTLDLIISAGVSLIYEQYDEFECNKGYQVFDWSTAVEFGINYDKVKDYSPGFREVSYVVHRDERIILWLIVHQLNITRNLLKNRPWKQTQVMTKELDYQEALVKSFIMYLGFLAIFGMDSTSITKLFLYKQALNIWRQNSGY